MVIIVIPLRRDLTMFIVVESRPLVKGHETSMTVKLREFQTKR